MVSVSSLLVLSLCSSSTKFVQNACVSRSKQWIEIRLVNFICVTKSVSKQDALILITGSSTVVQWTEPMLFKLATFPCIHSVEKGFLGNIKSPFTPSANEGRTVKYHERSGACHPLGVSVQGVSVQWELCPGGGSLYGGSVSRGISVSGRLPQPPPPCKQND